MNSSIVQSVVAVLLGAISSLAVVIFVEWNRKPRLAFSIAPPDDQNYTGQEAPVLNMRVLRIRVENEELRGVLRWWMRRESAENCYGSIRFLRLDGTNFFNVPMPARWAASPQPKRMIGIIFNGRVPERDITLWDTSTLGSSKIDIPAGETEDLDVVVRCDEQLQCYGFNNDSYRHSWKHPDWELPQGRYLIEVTVRSSGQKLSRRFLLNNDTRRDRFTFDPELEG